MKLFATLLTLAYAVSMAAAQLNCCPNQGCNLCGQEKQVNCETV